MAVAVAADVANAQRAPIKTVKRANHVISTGAAFVNIALRVNEVLITNVAPAENVGVIVPDGTHYFGPIRSLVGRGRMIDDDVSHRLITGRPVRAAFA